MLALVALVAVQLGAPPQAPSPTVAIERSAIDVVAFSDDGTFALAEETSRVGPTTRSTLLLVDARGVFERLPVSWRVDGILKDGVDREVCTQTAERLAAMAKDLRGVTVRIGLCSSINRDVVDVMSQPRPAVLSKKTAAFHQQVGFAGRVFLAPSGPLVIVVGSDELGNDRIGVALRDR